MMVSLRFSVALDKSSYSKNLNSSPSSIPFHVGRACVVNSLTRVTHVKANKPTSEEISLSMNTELLQSKNRSNSKKESKRNVGSRAGTLIRRNRWERELESCLFVNNGDFDVDYSVISSDLSLELCNSVLKRLGDENALRFFDWMRNNGKLEGNKTAYSFIFRVVCRRQDWVLAENLIEESKTQLDCQIFNALIHSCSKLGRADLGAKWFRAMLDRKIEPNAATYGMLMGLYRKSRNLEEAEFTFSHMRAEFPMISTVRSAYAAMITIYARLGLHRKAEEVIELVSSDGVRPDSDIWLAMLNAYSQQGKLNEAEAVLISMRESGFVPNIVAYNTLITGYGKASKIDEARRVFASVGEVGLEPDETSYRSMIEGLGRSGDHEEASRYYKKMKDSGFKPNSSNLFTMMNLRAKHGDEEGMAEILRDMLETGCERASIVGVLVRAHERFGGVEKLPSILRGSPWLRSHVLSNQASCSVVVSAYVKHGLVSEAVRVLKSKAWKDSGFEENLYHILICSCKEANRLENAVEIYSQFFPKKNKLSIHIACTMIDIFGSMGRFEEAERVYLELRSSGVALDVVGYTIVVRTFVQSGALDKASAAIDDMEKQKDVVSPDVYLLREMFRLYQRQNDVEKLSRLYHRASAKKENRAGWDKGMYECLINCCARAIPIDEISSLFQEMLRRRFVPNTVTVNVLLHLYGKAKMFRKAKKLFWLAEKWGLVDVVSYNTLISAYGKSKELGKMSSAAKLMSFKGFSVSLEAYTSMLDAYGKGNDMERFREVLEKMRESGFGSNPYGYNIRINIYGKRGWIDEVAGVLKEMSDCGARPDICGYNTLIKAYGIGGMVEEAVGVVREMREKGVEPDKITYLNLIAAAKRNDEFLEAVKWSLWMKQMGL